MYLFLSILLSTILGFILLMIGPPQVGGVIAFGIIVGSIFRGLYLLNNLNKSILKILSKYDSSGE